MGEVIDMVNYAENLMKGKHKEKHKKEKRFELAEVEWVHKPTSKKIILKTSVGEIDVISPTVPTSEQRLAELQKGSSGIVVDRRSAQMWRVAEKLEKFDKIKIFYSKEKPPQIIGIKRMKALGTTKGIEIAYRNIRKRFPMILKYVEEISVKKAILTSIWSKPSDKKKAVKEIRKLVEKLVIKSKSL